MLFSRDMIHPQDFEQRLSFDKIRERLRLFCASEPGRRSIENLAFSADYVKIIHALRQTHEALALLRSGEMYSTEGFLDHEPLVKTIATEGTYLEGADMLRLARLLQVLVKNRNFIASRIETLPALSGLIHNLELDDRLAGKIMQVVDEQGEVRTSASNELADIRKKLYEYHHRLRDTIQRVFKFASGQGWIPEGAQPTLRNGRMVIPVLAAYKRMVSGFIQDESASGQTVFIEPAEAVEAANRIRELELAERREVIRLLTALTQTLREQLSMLMQAFAFMCNLDNLRARAMLAHELDAQLPEVLNRPAMKWLRARHPILHYALESKGSVVPLDIELTETNRVLLISGPNAGGKSVCLKTAGLLQYMLQCGLLVPASADSQFGLFDDILTDIGDQQSIENDLSTYSSHLKNMALFINRANGRSLVLIDELGSGTDPNFGGAIAQAVLQVLINKGVWCIATTHYYNLKVFAGNTPGIRNGAMRFDETTLHPAYVLDIGKPGSSFAMEIAQKTGIPAEVLNHAKELAGADLLNFDRLLRKLQADRAVLDKLLVEAKLNTERLEQEKQRLAHELSMLEGNRKRILEEARAEAQRLIMEANREIEKTIRHIRENQAQKTETRKVRQRLKELAQQHADSKPVAIKKKNSVHIKPGDFVRPVGQQVVGEVLETDGKTAVIQLGSLKTRVKVSHLEKVGSAGAAPLSAKSSNVGPSLAEKRAQFKDVLDIRGKHVEEAIPILEIFIDTAILLGQEKLKILHGKGEGILRKAVRDKLKTYPQVASLADAHVEQGGSGVTVVVLK